MHRVLIEARYVHIEIEIEQRREKVQLKKQTGSDMSPMRADRENRKITFEKDKIRSADGDQKSEIWLQSNKTFLKKKKKSNRQSERTKDANRRKPRLKEKEKD